ncbi:MAG: glycosyltransferase family 1, partial [Akkermansiaceae bacterium]|nr:glycosyltransferase family 1 [Akkermansiaceae bacterium]
MKTLPSLALFVALTAGVPATAANLMLNFVSTSTNAAAAGNVTPDYSTLSPGHATGAIAGSQTTWNNLNSTASGPLKYADGSNAAGVNVTFSSEATAGSGILSFTSPNLNLSALYGSGGGLATNLYLNKDPLSIYGNGNNSSNFAVGRAGWLAGAANTAIGMRVDGLAASDYLIYVMARNTNSNAIAAPINLFASAASSSNTFNFSGLTPAQQANSVYPAGDDTTAYNSFIQGENYVVMSVSLSPGQSLFLASDGASPAELRGFLNAVQIVAVPEPSALLLSTLGLLAFVRR